MAADERWYFTKEQLANSPSRRSGIDADKELSYRQQAANFIQDMGQRLVVSQLCINTAIVYMHRFYVFHSLAQFHRNSIAAAALFLAAKVEEQPRKLEHVIKVAHMCLHRDAPALDTKSEAYLEQAHDLVFNENVLLQTLGFDVAIDHPHTHVVRCCHLVKASKDLAQTSYFMASNSLHLTTMCLQYKPTVVACFCIHLACKWSNWEIPISNEGKDWFWYVDKTVTWEQLAQLTGEFLHIFDKCPSRLRRKIRSISAGQSPNMPHPVNSPFESEPRKVQSPVNTDGSLHFQSAKPFASEEPTKPDNIKNKPGTSSSGRTTVDLQDYRDKREREKAAGRASSTLNAHHSSHHHKPNASNAGVPNKHSSSSSSNSSSSNVRQNVHHNHHHRQDVKSSSTQMLQQQRHSTSGSGGGSSSSTTTTTTSSQSRDPNRQRMSREYNVPSHHPPLDHSMDTANNVDSASSTIHPVEKLSNSIPNKSHDNRAADPRYNKQQHPQKDGKVSHGKYQQQRKPDILEQRSEEVRKLIEKPLPPPKPRAEQIKEEYAAMMLKKSHQPSRPITSANPIAPEPKMLNVGQTAFTVEKSPNAPVSASQIPHKQPMPLKNGSSSATSSFSLGNSIDDPKAEKRPRVMQEQENSMQTKHRSLFSPEKTPTPTIDSSKREREQMNVHRLKQKLKTPEATDSLSFSSPNSDAKQRIANNSTSQKLRDSAVDQDTKQQILEQHSKKFISSFSEQSKASKPLVDVKAPPELIKPFDDIDPIMNNQRHKMSNGLDSSFVKQEYSTIDLSSFLVKPELPEQLFDNEIPPELTYVKQETNEQLSTINEPDLSNIKRDSFSPLKSAQSISALLQEPLAPMPSLLQPPAMLQVQEEMKEPSTVDMSDLASAPVEQQPPIDLPRPVAVDDKKQEKEHRKTEKKKKEKKHKHKEKDKSKDKSHKHKHRDKDKEKHHKSSREKDKTEESASVSANTSLNASTASAAAVPIKITIPKDKLNLPAESIGSSGSNSSLKIKIPKERLKNTEQLPGSVAPAAVQAVPLKIKIRTSEPPVQENSSSGGGGGGGGGGSRKRDRSEGMDVHLPSAKKLNYEQQQQQQLQLQQQQQQQHHQQQMQMQMQRQNGRHSYSSGSNNKPEAIVDVLGDSVDVVEGIPKNFVPTSYGSSPHIYF